VDDKLRKYLTALIRSRIAAGRTPWGHLVGRWLVEVVEAEGLDQAAFTELRNVAEVEWIARVSEAQQWRNETDVDRLAQVFKELRTRGFVCSGIEGNAWTQSDLYDDLRAQFDERGGGGKGTAYYLGCHEQDIESCLFQKGALNLMHGKFTDSGGEPHPPAAEAAAARLRSAGFTVNWDGTAETRLQVADFSWHKRLPAKGPQPPAQPSFFDRFRRKP